MNNPFDYIPDSECNDAFRQLLSRLDALKKSTAPRDVNFITEIESGKMLGVLITEDCNGGRYTLYAFSGQLGDGGFLFPGFVGPVFDYLQPDGYFKSREAEISRQNGEIELFENECLTPLEKDFRHAKDEMDNELSAFREKCRLSKAERKSRRETGNISEEESAAMIRQSQFEKAELLRLKKRLAVSLDPIMAELDQARAYLNALKEKRRRESEDLQKWLFHNFTLLNARGESKSLEEIFAGTSMRIPPSGAGECCAPKLLHAAYKLGLKPIAIAEYWYGKPKQGEVRVHGQHYPACRGKCRPILEWMLQGLLINPPLEQQEPPCNPEPIILYENQWFCVVEKPSGILSVPGKGTISSVQQWLEAHYGPNSEVKVAHRLDQDTSGLLIATFGQQPYKIMQSLFATRKVHKTYIADLEGEYVSVGLPEDGRIELPLSPDWLDRPRQRIDIEEGKAAVTDFRFIHSGDGRSRVLFHPLTGRTHQLRVHAASDAGLGLPIVGDRLYGKVSCNHQERLHLHAHKIEFTFPLDDRNYCFESPVPF